MGLGGICPDVAVPMYLRLFSGDDMCLAECVFKVEEAAVISLH